MKFIRTLLVCTAFLSSAAFGQQLQPEREVAGNVITSAKDPAVRIRLPAAARYVGAVRFALYGIADCEIHVFVEADAKNVVQRLYWTQFEGYLPSKPDSTYGYSGAMTKLGDRDYYVRARFGPGAEVARQGSDLEQVQKLLGAGGYTLPAETINVRLATLLDAGRRRELMFIYMEDLASTGVAIADLMVDGKVQSPWPEIEKGIIARALTRISVENTGP